MPGPTTIISAAKRVPWKTLFVAGQQIYERGKKFSGNLSDTERSKLGDILRKSKGRRSNLTDREAKQLRDLVRKGFTGSA